MSARCYGEHIMREAGDLPAECCGSPAAGIKAHAEVCPLEDHDGCDAPTCACDWSGDCECPCDACRRARAAALDDMAWGDTPGDEDCG